MIRRTLIWTSSLCFATSSIESEGGGAHRVDNTVFAFGPFRLNPPERLLLKEEKPVRLGSRELDILITLVERAGEMVLKDQLIESVWPNTVVDEGALRVHVAGLRKALGDGQDGNRFVKTISGRGYSFIAPVTREQRRETAALPSQPARVGSLPAQVTRVIGRGDVIASVVSRLSQHRLLTIIGPGGIGKTTVAVAAAEAMAASYPDGAWFIELSTIIDAAHVPGAVGATLGISPSNIDPLTALAAWLRDKHLLIVLDCCEHVASAAAAIGEAVLGAAPGVRILATSREPLRASGEWVLRLPSLEVPPGAAPLTASEALGYSAVELFNERATATREGFVLSDTDVPAAFRNLPRARRHAAGSRTRGCAGRRLWHKGSRHGARGSPRRPDEGPAYRVGAPSDAPRSDRLELRSAAPG
jgi:DNA-binding winged helix-turn-helix (wHTH) protein